MASFIIHTIVGETLLNEIEKKYNITLSLNDRKQFLLGNLIPDSLQTDKTIPSNLKDDEKTSYKMEIKNRIRKEKLATHFRNPQKESDCLKIPETQLFVNEYGNIIQSNLSALGYLFHLYTDRIFFSKLFPETFDTLGNNMEEVNGLTEEEFDLVLKCAEIVRNDITIKCTACRYCVDDCPMNIAIPEYFRIYNDYKRFGIPKANTYRGQYNALLKEHGAASACIECGMCEEHCPQKLPVRELLKSVSDMLD